MKKIIFAALILITGLFDFVTFYAGKAFRTFEINPLYIYTKSILFMFIFKFAVIAIIIWYLTNNRQKTYFHSFFYVLCGVILIVAQSLGGISNLKVQVEQPSQSQVLEPAEAVKAHVNLSLFIVYLPMIISLVSFKTWEVLFVRFDKNVY